MLLMLQAGGLYALVQIIEFWGLQGADLVHSIQRVPCSAWGLVTRGQKSSSSGSLSGTM